MKKQNESKKPKNNSITSTKNSSKKEKVKITSKSKNISTAKSKSKEKVSLTSENITITQNEEIPESDNTTKVIYDKLTNKYITLHFKPEINFTPIRASKIKRVKQQCQTFDVIKGTMPLSKYSYGLGGSKMFNFNSYPLSFRMKYIFKLKFSIIKLKMNALFKRKSGKIRPSKKKYFSKNKTTVNYLTPLNEFSKDYFLKRVNKLFMKDVLNGSNFDFINIEKIKNKWNKKC